MKNKKNKTWLIIGVVLVVVGAVVYFVRKGKLKIPGMSAGK